MVAQTEYSQEDITVVVPAHNSEKYIVDCLQSVFKQKNFPFEIIIVINASTDKTIDLVQGLSKESPVTVHIVETSIPGVSNARNLGLSLAKTKLVALLDSDDLYEPSFLNMGIDALNCCPQSAFFFGNRKEFNETGVIKDKFLESTALNQLQYSVSGEFREAGPGLFQALLAGNFVSCSGVLLKVSALSNATLFPTNIKNSEDRYFFSKLALYNNAVYTLNNTHYYRRNPEGATQASDREVIFKGVITSLNLLRFSLISEKSIKFDCVDNQIEIETREFIYQAADKGLKDFYHSILLCRQLNLKSSIFLRFKMLLKSLKNSVYDMVQSK